MAYPASSAGVSWRDLCRYRRRDYLLEFVRPSGLWLLAVWLFGAGEWLAGGVSLVFAHIALLRTGHNAVHCTLGIGRRYNRWVMTVVSGLLATSFHALAQTHLRHHARCLAADDLEGQIAHLPFWRALLASPTYHFTVIGAAWRQSSGCGRRLIIGDGVSVLLVHGLLWANFGGALCYFWALLLVLNGLSGLLGVWLFHRGTTAAAARSAHGSIFNALAMGMLYHAEHHQYPGVPTARLSELSRRLLAAGAMPPAPLWHAPAKPQECTS